MLVKLLHKMLHYPKFGHNIAEADAYREMTVRLYGYSAYFVNLDTSTQEELISRNMYTS